MVLGGLCFGLCFEALCGPSVASLPLKLCLMMSLNRACSMALCKHSALGSAESQYHSGFVGPQKGLQSWKWECAYKVLDNHSSLHI